MERNLYLDKLIKHIQDLNVLYVCGKGIEMNR